MALSAKKLQEVMKEKRRRDKLPPRTVIVEPVPLSLKPRELSQVTEKCSDVLLAIESTIVQSARELSMVDDLVVKHALTCLIATPRVMGNRYRPSSHAWKRQENR